MRTKVNLSEIEDIKNGTDPATNLRRSGFVVISQLRNEFEKVDFSKKFLDDLKAFKIEFPTTTKKHFIEDETTRLNKIKEYLQHCLPDNYSDFPEYQILNSYLDYMLNPTPEQHKKLQPNEIEKLNIYYQTSIDKNVLNCTVTDFINMVENASFENLTNHKKAKLKFLIYLLSKFMGAEWYTKAARSIGATPAQCSGANVAYTDLWRRAVEKIK